MTLAVSYHPRAVATDHPLPVIDEDSRLRFDGRWVALTDLQVPVVACLLDHLGYMVSVGELGEAYAAGGGSTDFDAMRSLLFRIGRRVDEVGLEVVFARRRTGMMVSLPLLRLE
jgi:hypothetical protein